MSLIDLLPILIPGTLIQLFIQGYYIHHCLTNKNISEKQKIIFTLSIAFFNIIAAAIYLFLTSKYSKEVTEDGEYNQNIKEGIFVCLIFAFEVFALRVITEIYQQEYYYFLTTIIGITFTLFIINNLLFKKLNKTLRVILPVSQLILIIIADFLGPNLSTQLVVLAIVAGIINAYPLEFSKIYSIIGLIIYTVSNTIKMFLQSQNTDMDTLIGILYTNLIMFVLFFAAAYSLKKQFITNKLLKKTLSELKVKSQRIEELSVIAERNRIAGQIHDTVGHSLTTAIVAIDTGKLQVAKQQVRESLQKIRDLVKTFQDGGQKDFQEQVRKLVDDVTNSTDIQINAVIELESKLLTIQQNILLNAIKECITNSIKHGHCTQFDLLIQEYKDKVHILCSDNGECKNEINFGFGLSNMKKAVESIGGELIVQSNEGEGFSIKIIIPISTKDKA